MYNTLFAGPTFRVDGLAVSWGDKFSETGRDFSNFCLCDSWGRALLSLARELQNEEEGTLNEQSREGLQAQTRPRSHSPLGMEMSLATAPHTDILLTPLLQEARAGSSEALGQLFETCCGYLLTVARQELRPSLRAKVDAADLVQETFVEAMRDFLSFRGETETQLLNWLRGILRHNLADITRRFDACCRCLAQEVRLLDQSVGPLRPRSPLVVGRTICEQLIAQELRLALEAALQRLPPSYRQVLQLRCGERQSFAEIGSHLQRSPEAARKLWCRAVERLRQDLGVYGEV